MFFTHFFSLPWIFVAREKQSLNCNPSNIFKQWTFVLVVLMPMSHIRMFGFDSWLHLGTAASCQCRFWGMEKMAQVTGLLPPTWKIWISVSVFGGSLAQGQLLQIFGKWMTRWKVFYLAVFLNLSLFLSPFFLLYLCPSNKKKVIFNLINMAG